MPNMTDLRRLGEPDVANAARVLARSFPEDPMMRYVFLDEPQADIEMFLAFIGVAPDHQGKGFSGALIKPMLERISSENMPCYVETATEKNTAIYRHFGFRIIEKVCIPETDLDLYTMIK